MSRRSFTPDEPGTSEPAWLGDARWDGVSAATPSDLAATRVIVLAAHPDDETLGVGALVADLAAAGTAMHIVVATDGSASHPHSMLWTPELLAEVRRRELEEAVTGLAPGAAVHHLDLSDGTLAGDPARLLDAVRAALPSATEHEVILAPFDDDGHPDHDTLGAAAQTLARERSADLWFYPIWLWQWAEPDGLAWDRLLTIAPSAAALHAKAAAIRHHRSQVGPLSPLPGDETLLPPHVLVRFRRAVEILIAGPGTPLPDTAVQEDDRRARRREAFDAMLGDTDDPWDSQSWYERRKHALTLALRTREDYPTAVDIGCSTGAFTAILAQHADHVTAYDGSEDALAVARRRGLSHVTWVSGEIPAALHTHPDHSADLVVVSEIAYFLTGAELLALLRHVRRILRPEGEVVFVDWLEGSDNLPLDGNLVHDQINSALSDLPVRVRYEDDSVRIDVRGGRALTPDGP